MGRFNCVCEYVDGKFTVLCGAHLNVVREERDHCVGLVEAPVPGLEQLIAARGDANGIKRAHIVALTEAAKAIRESGEFRDARFYVKTEPT